MACFATIKTVQQTMSQKRVCHEENTYQVFGEPWLLVHPPSLPEDSGHLRATCPNLPHLKHSALKKLPPDRHSRACTTKPLVKKWYTEQIHTKWPISPHL